MTKAAHLQAASDAVAWQSRRRIEKSEFWGDVAALAMRLPKRKYTFNLCTDRYRFMVGFAAALQRGQISLMPSSDAPGVLRALAEDYPDSYALTEATLPGFTCLVYPEHFSGGAATLRQIVPSQPAIILFTSGSTGKPKAVPKSWGPLTRSAAAARERLGIARLAGATVIGTVPHQHSYGLESLILLSLRNGLALDAAWPLYPADIRAAIAQAPRPRILVTTPVHIRALLAEPDDMPQVDLIISATAPLPVALAQVAEACFGAQLIEIYGCTEAGQVATRRTALETQWQCLDGVELRWDTDGAWASGAAVEGTALLHDMVGPAGAGRFILGEREADLVDVAGKRASLAQLNHQLLSVAGVRDGIFAMTENNDRLVARLMAVAVAPGLSKGEILRALRERIDPAFLPRPLILVDKLPRNALGKLPRDALLRLAGSQYAKPGR